MENNVTRTFNKLAQRNEKALIGYVVGGYPTLELSREIIEQLILSGVDIVEIGVPFSDPMADGPIIQEAFVRTLNCGIAPKDCLNLVKSVRERHKETPLLLMTYSNILYSNGLDKFLIRSKNCDLDGFIVPDLNFEEADDYLKETSKLDLATVFLTSPNTSAERLEKIAALSTGFVYMVSVFGITGSRNKFERYTFEAVSRSKAIVSSYGKHLAVGFGISNAKDGRRMIESGADGIIIGSSLINIITKNEHDKNKMMSELDIFVKELKAVCKFPN
ncbi:tryptophan synthase subunit alpha [Candidatus Nitrosocosmicus arcticus]|uniref:Tryptophan synthase alpha chain n=1 Tax=Candidatus Nitrosocosmicus arcticus TaxID=2035267 RepID=A0A557SQY4_9ARCH|nr:tryptophan synthase subunit alpha [Candidatus Nitrosocosmicus arcticus]TVP39017.1 tryptophan synthase alpha chain [Candidatus Nitrosocosmicus arcticus]